MDTDRTEGMGYDDGIDGKPPRIVQSQSYMDGYQAGTMARYNTRANPDLIAALKEQNHVSAC